MTEITTWWQQLLQQPMLMVLLITILLLFLLLGWSLHWLSSRSRVNELQQQLQQYQHDALTNAAEFQYAKKFQQQLQQQYQQQQSRLDELQQQHTNLREQYASLQAASNSDQRNLQQQIARLESAEQRLGDTFKRLAGDVFEEKTRAFKLTSNEQITGLINPLQSQLKDFREQVREMSNRGISQHGQLLQTLSDLKTMNQNLGEEASQLSQALRGSNKLMGNLGETRLERLLQSAGLQRDSEFKLQVTLHNDKGELLRPDAVIYLPDDKAIIIDAKMSLEHYANAFNADNTEEGKQNLLRHCQSLRAHIAGLAKKGYTQTQELQTPDFVLMFVPVEAALIEAVQLQPQLMDYAMENGVAMIGPTNLLATVRTISSLWQVWRQNENAQEIASRGGRLYDKFANFVDDLNEIGERVQQTDRAWHNAMNKLSEGNGNLLRQAEMLQDLGAKTSKKLGIRSTQALAADSEVSEVSEDINDNKDSRDSEDKDNADDITEA